jgi:hypothetical protein
MPSSYVNAASLVTDGTFTSDYRGLRPVGYVPSGHYFAEMPEMRPCRVCHRT